MAGIDSSDLEDDFRYDVKLGGGWALKALKIRSAFRPVKRMLALAHANCSLPLGGTPISRYHRGGACGQCGSRPGMAKVGIACFHAEILQTRLYGWEMRQANLRRWYAKDRQKAMP